MTQKNSPAQTSFMAEIFVDGFAGGGGTSTGYEFATGRPADIAINHNPEAIRLHKANHPYTEHYQTSIWEVDPRAACKGRPVGLAWFSPDCTHFSKARGGKPVKKEIRSLSWVVLKWALDVRPRVLMMENVEEIQTWGPTITVTINGEEKEIPDPDRVGETFQAFIGALTTGIPADHPAIDEICEYLHLKRGSPQIQKIIDGLGYAVEYQSLIAADFGAPTTRKRFALVGRCDGKPIVWPERTHAPRDSKEVKSGKCKPWRSAAEIIDWSLPSYSIFASKKEIKEKHGVDAIRPLADNTLRRVICGVDKFTIKSGDPFLAPFGVECNHSGGGHIQDLKNPLNTVTGKHTGGIAQPIMSPFTFGNTSGSVGVAANEPVRTITTAGNQVLGAPIMAPFTFSNTGGSVGSPANEPVHTIRTAGGQVFAAANLMSIGQTGGGDRIRDIKEPVPTTVSKQESCVVAANLIQYHTEQTGNARTSGLNTPIPTIDTANRYGLVSTQLVEYYGTGNPLDVREPMHTVTSRDREAVVSAHLSEFRSASIGRDMRDPAGTVTSREHEGIVSAHIQKYFGGVVGEGCGEPLPTVTAIDHNALCSAHMVKFKGQELGTSPAEPVPTIVAQSGAGGYATCQAVLVKMSPGKDLGYWPQIRELLNKHCGYNLSDDEVILLIIRGIAYYIADITLRMLTPRELYNAMGFPPDYIIEFDYMGRTYSKKEQVARCGNAVSPPMAEALIRANFPEWCVVVIDTMAALHSRVTTM